MEETFREICRLWMRTLRNNHPPLSTVSPEVPTPIQRSCIERIKKRLLASSSKYFKISKIEETMSDFVINIYVKAQNCNCNNETPINRVPLMKDSFKKALDTHILKNASSISFYFFLDHGLSEDFREDINTLFKNIFKENILDLEIIEREESRRVSLEKAFNKRKKKVSELTHLLERKWYAEHPFTLGEEVYVPEILGKGIVKEMWPSEIKVLINKQEKLCFPVSVIRKDPNEDFKQSRYAKILTQFRLGVIPKSLTK